MSDKESISLDRRVELEDALDEFARRCGLRQPFRQQFVDGVMADLEYFKKNGRWPDEFDDEVGESEANRAQE